MKRKNKSILAVAGMFAIATLIYAFLSMIAPTYGIYTPFTAAGFEVGTSPEYSASSSKAASGVGVSPETPSGFSATTTQCTDPNYPVYCSNVGMCFVSGVVCSTVESCGGSYYGCFDGDDKVVCIHGDSYCFDKCIKEDTIAECGSGLWGCWIEGCEGHENSIPFCYNEEYHCCPTDYPIYNQQYGSCWGEGWDCIYPGDCATGQVCENHNCVEKKECPACPPSTGWGECHDGKMTRVSYRCGADTNYQCYAQTDEAICGSACTIEFNTGSKQLSQTSLVNDVLYDCPTAPIEEAFDSIWDITKAIWWYDGSDWHVYMKDIPSNLDIAICGETYIVETTQKGGIFRCPYADQPVCGNGVCDPGEDAQTCPSDCGAYPYCGNGICETGETYLTCSLDCYAPQPQPDNNILIWAVVILIIVILLIIIYFAAVRS